MKRVILLALLSVSALSFAQTAFSQTASAPAPLPSSPAKKELVKRLMTAQQTGIENFAAGVMVEQPAMQLLQEADRVLQQMPPEKREAVAKTIQADARKYMEEAVPLVRERATKLAPSTIAPAMEEKFTEEELKQLVTWLESPANKKYVQLSQEIQNNFGEKLAADVKPLVLPKLQTLQGKVKAALGISDAAPPAKAAPAGKKASGK
jgi:uncharacterized protein